VCYVGWLSPKQKGQFWGKHLPDNTNTPNNCELDWSTQWHTTRADARLQALDESFIGREVGDAIAQRREVWCLRLPCCSLISFRFQHDTMLWGYINTVLIENQSYFYACIRKLAQPATKICNWNITGSWMKKEKKNIQMRSAPYKANIDDAIQEVPKLNQCNRCLFAGRLMYNVRSITCC